MELKDRLAQVRKLRGMNQESLAERVGVSRQAVSKWETGEAMPDCAKLMALADALEVSMDYLCGRAEKDSSDPEPAKTPGPNPKKRLSGRIAALCLLAVLLLGAGLGIGLLVSGNRGAESETFPQEVVPLPDVISVEGFDINLGGGEGLTLHFIPSVINENYTYQVSLCDSAGNVRVFDAAPQGGICMCRTDLKLGYGYTVTAVIGNGEESRSVLLCSSFDFDSSGGSWIPAQ